MSVFASPSFDGHELVAFSEDKASGLRAIIAVHNTNLGAAVGGCRFYPYLDESAALEDVLRLSRGMTYKSALAGLPMGGGKAVIIGDPRLDKTPAVLLAMGRFINSLGGKYITAEDSGTNVADMQAMAEVTPYVSGLDSTNPNGGDPSPYTAYGLLYGIKAAIKYKLGLESLSGLSVAVQGAGAVGRYLIQHLIEHGVEVFVTDIDDVNLAIAVELGAKVIAPDTFFKAKVNVLSPCAMGAILNDQSIAEITAPIIVGGANNQLAEPRHGEVLARRGILYAPDFVANAGGIIAIYHQKIGSTEQVTTDHVAGIFDTLMSIFAQSEVEHVSTHVVAARLAEARFSKPTRTV